MTQGADGWIEWAGGKRPVPWDARIDVRLRSGQQLDSCFATTEAWQHVGSPSDIVAYRMSQAPEPPSICAVVEDEITLDQKFDQFTQQFAQAVVKLDGRFDKLSAHIAAAIAATDDKIRNALLLVSADPPKRFHTGGIVGRENNHLFGERPSPHIIPIKVRKRDLENESAAEIRPSEKAEVQSDFAEMHRRALDFSGASDGGETVSSMLARFALQEIAALPPAPAFTYSSHQATKCAGCGEHKHTPLRRDEMGGYVCLTCIDKRLNTKAENESAPEIRPSEKVEVQSDFAELATQICTYLTTRAFEDDEAIGILLRSYVPLIERLIASTLRRATLSRYDNNGRFMGDVMTAFVKTDSDQVRRALQSEVDPDGTFERAYAETFGRCLVNESAPEQTIESKAEAQSDLDEARARHILKLWDRAQKIVLDGYSYRTKGIDHAPQPELF